MKPNCTKCKHYFITFNPRTPKGCRIYQIQSQALPSTIVKQANQGPDCIGFEAKPQANHANKKIDLNDPKLW
jgi:hypothetical protein